jgi:non-ribosomal peptide synthetase component E (peptide arylation enzyme)
LNPTTPETGRLAERSLLNLLLHHPLPDADTLVYAEDRDFTVAEFGAAASRLAATMARVGVHPGSVVAAIVEGGPLPLIVMYASWLGRCTCHVTPG